MREENRFKKQEEKKKIRESKQLKDSPVAMVNDQN